MKTKLVKVNIATAAIYQIIVVICGFILPRFLLKYFGSEINGLVNSVTQFLSVVSFMELGVGAVVSSSLYGPLAERKWNEISQIVSAADVFFKKIAHVLMGYVAILTLIYPYINSGAFDMFFSGSLIVIISVNSFAQYYFGVVDNIILNADQKSYIVYSSQAAVHLLNTIICILIMQMGAGIHMVKAVTAGIYLLRPVLVRQYIKKNYLFRRHVKYRVNVLGQKWNAMAQHISECVLDSTDVIILTIFSTLSNVSVYGVYNLVVYNLKNFFLIAITSGVLPTFGNLYATNKKQDLYHFFKKTEWIIHNLVILIFGITAVMVVPFVMVYTKGIMDAEYVQPMFALLIVFAHACHCIRLPYFLMIKATGHYKQTQRCFIASTTANIIISILFVKKIGLVGVAIGTLAAMAYQTFSLAVYVYRQFFTDNTGELIKRILLDGIAVTGIIWSGKAFVFTEVTYIGWIIMAFKVAITACILTVAINLIFEYPKVRMIIKSNLR